ncbi:hypothetical protein Hanom_Chr03g00268841 [Helianthus anomalus]
MLATYSVPESSSGTMHTCLPHVWVDATANPMLVVNISPRHHVSTMSVAFQPAAIADINSVTLDPW